MHGFLEAGTPFASLGLRRRRRQRPTGLTASTQAHEPPPSPSHLPPEGVVVHDELADALGGLAVDAFCGQQHVQQLEHGDDGMEPDSLRSQHLHGALLSVHEHDGVCHLEPTHTSSGDRTPADTDTHLLLQHLQSLFVENLSGVQDAAAAGHRVLDDQTRVPLTKRALHQTFGSWRSSRTVVTSYNRGVPRTSMGLSRLGKHSSNGDF